MAAASASAGAGHAASAAVAAATGPASAVLIAGSAPEAIAIDLDSCRPVSAADGSTIKVPRAAVDAWGFVQELELDDDEEDVPAIMVPTKERLQRLADFSVKYAQQGIDWEAYLMKKVAWMEIPTLPDWLKTDLADMPTATLFDLIEDAAAVGFTAGENAGLMRVAWRIKEMDEATAMQTFALSRQWEPNELQAAVAPGSAGDSLARFVNLPRTA